MAEVLVVEELEVAGNMEDILFIDIETVPQEASYTDLDDRWRKLWDHKAIGLARNEETPEELYPRAGIYAEFGKVICISAGFVTSTGDKRELRIKSFYGHDEKQLLTEFCNLLDQSYFAQSHFLCAHNGKEFDFPYLCRRILINELPMPGILDLAGKKPWEVKHLDTLQLWKFGDSEVIHMGANLLILAAIFQLGDGLQAVSVGLLRGIEDTVIPSIIIFIAYWVIAIPAGYYLSYSKNVPVIFQSVNGIWIGLSLGLTISAIALTYRFYYLLRSK
ncbi:MATE family efflux transporter [Bacteroidia bacterium]|nr:MATE family efflux transporter [Bacteroidia bacterium]